MMTTKKKTKMGEINETPLPEAMIHHIQSFMTAKEAARSAILSKSWYNAWLTRPTIALDDRDFRPTISPDDRDFRYSDERFQKFAVKTAKRYELMDLKIDSFRLRSGYKYRWIKSLIATAMKLGPTDVELELSLMSSPLPQEVLGSETLVRLSVSRSRLEDNYLVRCSRLKSLTLECVEFEQHLVFFGDLTRSCIFLEELSVSNCRKFTASRANLNELHKLRRLHLDTVNIDSMFFTDFASRFPCLKDLSVVHCQVKIIDIATTSLDTISYKPLSGTYKAKFNVPNLRKFAYASCCSTIGLSIKGALKEWDFDISITVSYNLLTNSRLKDLKTLLTSKSKRSRITSLSVRLHLAGRNCLGQKGDVANLDKEAGEVDPEPPVVVDNLRIVDTGKKSSCTLLVRLFRICRPKFITHCLQSPDCKPNCRKQEYWDEAFGKIKKSWGFYEREALQILCKKLMKQLIAPNWGVPDEDMFGRFGLKRVKMEVFDKFGTEWRPLVFEKPLDSETIPVISKRKVRFELIWD